MSRVLWALACQLLLVGCIAYACCFGSQWMNAADGVQVTWLLRKLVTLRFWKYTPHFAALTAAGLVSFTDPDSFTYLPRFCRCSDRRLELVSFCARLIFLTSFTVVQGLILAVIVAGHYVQGTQDIDMVCGASIIFMVVLHSSSAFSNTWLASQSWKRRLCVLTILGGIAVAGLREQILFVGVGLFIAGAMILEHKSMELEPRHAADGVIQIYLRLSVRPLCFLSKLSSTIQTGQAVNHSIFSPLSPAPRPSAASVYAKGAGDEDDNDDLPGLKLHDSMHPSYIPPERWCVTRKDLMQFVADVKDAWIAGLIPDSANYPNPYHDDPNVGPTMYQVTEFFIKPYTLERGGASYALTLHPEGSPQPCDVFMTHAWAEGVFEFADKMLRNWPSDCRYLWICFLANPQNGDIGALLAGPVMQSPFAKALDYARKMVVIPNRFISIYERMWCVLEAKIAIERKLDIIVPSAATRQLLFLVALRALICISLSTALAMAALMAADAEYTAFSTCLFFVLVRCTVVVITRIWRAEERDTALHESRAALFGFALGMSVYILMKTEACDSKQVSSNRVIAWSLVSSTPLAVQWTIETFRRDILASEAKQLTFTSVRDAKCTDPVDKARIEAATAGQEDQIDAAIKTLRQVGEINAQVREELELGFDPTEDCIFSVRFSWGKLVAMIVLWALGFGGNSWRVCGASTVAGPPTILGLWENWLALSYFGNSEFCLQLGALFCSSTITLLYAVVLRPRSTYAGIFVDALWRAGIGFALVFIAADKTDEAMSLSWSESSSRKLARIKVCAFFCAFAAGFFEAACAVAQVSKGQLWRVAVLAAVMVLPSFLALCVLFATFAFEGCVIDCRWQVGYSDCVRQCGQPRLSDLLAAAFCETAACIVFMSSFHICLFSKPLEQAPATENVELIEISRLPLSRPHLPKSENNVLMEVAPQDKPAYKSKRGMWLHKLLCGVMVVTLATATCLALGYRGTNLLPYSLPELFPEVAAMSRKADLVLVKCRTRSQINITEACLLLAITGRITKNYSGHTDEITSVAFSSDSTKVLTGSLDGTAKLWDLRSGDILTTFAGHRKSIRSVALSSDSAKVLTGSDDMTAKLWDARTGEILQNFNGHRDRERFTSVALSSKSTEVLTGSLDGMAKLWNASAGGVLRRYFFVRRKAVKAVALSSDDTKVLIGSLDNTAKLFDAHTGALLQKFVGHKRPVMSVALSTDSTKVLTGSSDGTARLWDARIGAVLQNFSGHSKEVTSVALSNDNTKVLTGSRDQTANLWDARSGYPLENVISQGSPLSSIVLSRDCTKVLTGSDDGIARLWDTRTGEILKKFSPQTGPSRADVLVLNRILKGSGPQKRSLTSVGLSSDGTRVVTGGWDRTAKLWDARTGATLQNFVGHEKLVASVALSSDDTKVLTGSWDGTAKTWDAVTGDVLTNFTGHRLAVISVALSSDGTTALTGSLDGTAKLWDTRTGYMLQNFDEVVPNKESVTSVALSSDGTKVLIGSKNKTAKLWDAATGDVLHTFFEESEVTSVAFDSDGLFGIYGTHGAAQLFSIRTGQTLQEYRETPTKVSNGREVALSIAKGLVVTSTLTGAQVWDLRTAKLQRDMGTYKSMSWLD